MTSLEAGGHGTVNKKPIHIESSLDNVGYETRPLDTEVERRLLRKIDWFLMPAMVIGTIPSSIIYMHFRY